MSSLFSPGGKRAVITGSSRGIGKNIAEGFAEHGGTGQTLVVDDGVTV